MFTPRAAPHSQGLEHVPAEARDVFALVAEDEANFDKYFCLQAQARQQPGSVWWGHAGGIVGAYGWVKLTTGSKPVDRGPFRGPSRGPFRGPLYFDRFCPVDRKFLF